MGGFPVGQEAQYGAGGPLYGTGSPIGDGSPYRALTPIFYPLPPPGIDVWNPAFDVTPHELITGGIVTEFGVFRPEELRHALGGR